jgi:hypothetical protein
MNLYPLFVFEDLYRAKEHTNREPNETGLDISNYVKSGLKQIILICSEYWDLDLKRGVKGPI